MRVDYATAIPLFSNRVRDADPEGCVAVLDVERDSPSWKAGLRPGDFVTHVGDQRVGRPVEFFAALQGKNGPIPLRMTGVAERESRKIVAPQ